MKLGEELLTVVVDAWSRRGIGWAMGTHLRLELVLAALDIALRHGLRVSELVTLRFDQVGP